MTDKLQAPRGTFDVQPEDARRRLRLLRVTDAALAAFMFVLYIPLGYFTDTMIHRFRQRKRGAG